VLTGLAASSHFAYDDLCFVSLLDACPFAGPPLQGGRKKIFYWGPNPLSAALVPLPKTNIHRKGMFKFFASLPLSEI
jgi:hypothetical protein